MSKCTVFRMTRNAHRHFTLSKQHFKASKEKHQTFSTSLDALLSGKKPAILFDISFTTSSTLQHFLDSNPYCADNHLKVVQLVDDVFIVDTDQISSLTSDQTFIDCSRHLEAPRLMNVDLIKQFQLTMREFIDIIKASPSPVDLSPQCSNLCLTTIFGMFLLYPFVYYTSDEGNCLGGEELYLFKVGCEEGVFTSYTCPVRLCSEVVLRRLREVCSVERVVMDCVAL